MKTAVMYLFCFCVLALGESFTAAAQENGESAIQDSAAFPATLRTIISVNLDNVPFETALAAIEEKGGIRFNYIRDHIPVGQPVSARLRNVPLYVPLMKILNETGMGLRITSDGLLAVVPVRANTGRIMGTVIDRETKEGLCGANVVVRGTTLGASTGDDGAFVIPKLSPGVYALEISIIGFERKYLENIAVGENDTVKIVIEIEEKTLSLSEIVVTPGHFSLMEKEPVSRNALRAEHVRNFPQLGEDVFRAVKRLPGLAGNDYSAKFSIRGGEHDEVLVMLDGMELYDPFHLKDAGGVFSIIDVELIDNVDITTGAFPAEYSNKLSGVFNMRSRTPAAGNQRTSVAVSFLTTRFLSEGSFQNGKGSWQVLARRGYIDYILRLLGEDDNVNPVYYDIYNKVQYFINPGHLVSAHLLTSADKLRVRDDEINDTADLMETRHDNTYGWVKWEAGFTPRLYARTVLSAGRITQDKTADENDDGYLYCTVLDKRYFNVYGIRQDWNFNVSDRMILYWGFELKKLYADYDYNTDKILYWLPDMPTETTNIVFKRNGSQSGLYIKGRFRPFEPLAAEIGLRYDRMSWSGDEKYSPRANISCELSENMTFRAGWGKFYQSHGIHQLSVIDEEKKYFPADEAEHFVTGLEYVFGNNISLRLETYLKKFPRIRPRYYNYMDEFDMTPETAYDRIIIDPEKGESKGVELYIHTDDVGKHSIWMSYGYLIVEEIIDGIKTPRKIDQRHTVNVDYNYRPDNKWSLNISWRYNSGWPYTDERITGIEQVEDRFFPQWEQGPVNGSRLPAYHRMDIRLNRNFYTSKGQLSMFIEARNLYDRQNIRSYKTNLFIHSPTDYETVRKSESWLPLIPSFGVSWTF